MKNKLTLVYIVGRGHSGSTLLELLLNRTRGVASMGELDLMSLQIYRDDKTRWIGRCSCKKRPYHCKIWSEIIAAIKKIYGVNLVVSPFSWRLSDVGIHEEMKKPGIKESIRYGYHRLIRTLFYTLMRKVPYPLDITYRKWITRRDFVMKKYAELTGAQTIVDASKDQLHMRDLDNYSSVEQKILFLTRDVRGNVWSAIKRQNVSAKKEAKEWNRLNKKILKLLSKVNQSKYHHVRYEDLCANTEETLRQIHKFIGIEYNPMSSKEEFEKRHTIAGNKIRFKEIESVKHDLGWKSSLSKADLATIKRIAGKTASRLGYNL